MLTSNHDLGASLYKTWSDAQRREEIARLVDGYRNGLPLGILCKMSETISGSRKKAKKILSSIMTKEERSDAIAKESGGMLEIARSFLA